jgi:hypothetical protein
MKGEEIMLSFELAQHPGCKQHIQIYCDNDGLTSLIETLVKFQQSGDSHIPLCAPSAGGKMLSDKTPFGNEAIGEIVITIGGD